MSEDEIFSVIKGLGILFCIAFIVNPSPSYLTVNTRNWEIIAPGELLVESNGKVYKVYQDTSNLRPGDPISVRIFDHYSR